jgi:F-box protein 11
VYIYANGQGTLEDNDIFANENVGVGITTGSNPTLRKNKIHNCSQSGVQVYANGKGILEENDIFENAYAGVRISKSGNPILRNNRIVKNKYEAIWITDNSGGTFENNDLRENKRGTWDIAPGCKGKVIRKGNIES